MDALTQSEFAWCLPGEIIQVRFDHDFDFSPVNPLGDSSFSSSSSSPWAEPLKSIIYQSAEAPASLQGTASTSDTFLSPSPERSCAKKSKAHPVQNPLATLLSAAGNTIHSRLTQDSSDLSQHHHHYHNHYQNHQQRDSSSQHHSLHHGHHGYTHHHNRSRTHPGHDLNKQHSLGSGSMSQDPGKPALRTCLVITNFRICSTQQSPLGHDTILAQVAHSSIATITLQEHRISLTLKFDSPQYIISQQSHGPPTISDVMSCLRRLVFNEEVRTRFPYSIGQFLLEQDRRAAVEGKDVGQTRANLWTAEDVIVPSSRSKRNASCGEPSEKRMLGWTGGYDIHREFKRLNFDDSLWTVAHLNRDFELSPTYPEQYIMPISFLDHGGASSSVDQAARFSTSPGSDPPSSLHTHAASGFPEPRHSYSANACMKQLAAFRSNKRFPMICWRSPDTGLVLMRSSQPMVGFLGARGPEDETYIRTVLTTAAREHRRSHSGRKCTPKLCIMDARAYTSAVANGYVGGGRENPDHYPNATISYMSLANIHVIANSHQTLLKAVSTQSDSTNWFTLIESTGWLTHVADLLKAASGREGIVGKMLDQNCSLLVHCTDGWDRTTQLVSLAQILLDPYYRTIQGLRVLIEKEWLSAGHPFQSRTDALSSQKKAMSVSPLEDEPQDSWRASATMLHSSPNGAKESISFSRKKWKRPLLSDSESKVESKTTLPSTCLPETRPTPSVENGSPSMRPPVLPSSFTGTPSSPKYTPMPVQTVPLAPSPVFLLFLTCLHHIVQQHPTRFEYNDYLLVVLARAAAGFSPFGDFLYNNEHERAQDRLRERTLSIWKWVHENQGWFTSHDYIPPELGERTSRNLGEGGWREHVLHVQTGGRFTSLWTEYYFNSTPNWFPDPRMVLSNATSFYDRSGSGGQLEKPVGLRCLRHHVRVLADPWYGSQFDETQLQHIAFPGAASMQQHGYCPQGGHGPGQNIGTVTTIPPALASLKGQEMHMYYMLAQHLRAKRRKLMQRAFRSWRKWARRRVAVKPAREDGWEDGAISGSNSSQEDDFRHEDMESDDNDEEEEEEEGDIKRKRAAPELKILGAKKGIEVVMGRILESGPFFGERITLEYEEDTEEEEEQAARNEEEEIRRRVMEGIEGEIGGIVVDESEEGLEGAFDDFGFPVGVDEKEVFIAV